MDAFQNLFLRRLAERLNAEISDRTAHLLDRKARAKDYAEYTERVAFINALKEVGVWMEEINRDLSRPDVEQPNPNRARRSAPYGS